ncbi:unnamed protein product [Pieris macdunnoughi]|uniref:Uncharacterized protein n=1 Tax=Pieris macdunnoughi TaxID=345717 RepID=A0A821WQC2_9NEOP|nr:unnamed protein product [Pieris macdunnoughi]
MSCERRIKAARFLALRCEALPASPPGLERLLTRPVPPMSYLLQSPRSVPARLLTPRDNYSILMGTRNK